VARAALPAAPLPALRLTADRPDAAVLAVPTRSSDQAVAVLGDPGLPDAPGLLAREKAKGDAGEVVAAPQPGDGPLERVLLLGVGDGSPAALRKAGAAAARRARSSTSLAVDLRGVDGLTPDGLRALAEGALLAAYSYTRKSKAEPRALGQVTLVVVDPVALQPAADRAVTTATATAAARDLVNTPSLVKTPEWLAGQAKELLRGLDVVVRDEKALAEQGFGGILAVGQGSTRPPRLVEATWDGGGRHVVLVGKGITFDTGGLSLKPNDGMVAMKTDMGGGAAVLGALRAAADLRLPLRVTALVAAAENMPSGTAQRPGDVITHYGGRTVEVLNTDAEGRLVLADAIAYADLDLDADVIVDVATLTGAMPVALGRRHAGLFASDDALAAELEAASAASGERLWRMPLTEDYLVALDSPVADLRNIGDPRKKLQGGSITAALFLREFTGGRPWAHLDIAGPGRSDGEEDEITKGGTGYGVRLLVRWLEALAEQRPAKGARRRTA
jgi:leucyl aminopeptidase